jgi:hypothetical protein
LRAELNWAYSGGGSLKSVFAGLFGKKNSPKKKKESSGKKREKEKEFTEEDEMEVLESLRDLEYVD